MAHRIRHLASALNLSSTKPAVAPNGLPLPVAVGLVRGASAWSVLFMWRHSKRVVRWRRLFEEDQSLDTFTGFLNYVTFMFRLYVYGYLFARAVRYHLTGKEERSEDESEAKDNDDDDEDEDEDDDDGDGDDDDEDEDYDDGKTGGELQLNLGNTGGEMTVLESLGRCGNEVEVGTRSDGVTVVRKTYRHWKATAHELKSYILLRDHGVAEVAPKLLGHWRNEATGEWTMELEYVSATPRYQLLQDLHDLKLYMSGLLQALALLHEKVGLVHRDIKPANILADFTPTGMRVRLVDFEFAYRLGDTIRDDRCGTEGYVSPEWRRATPRVADPRTNQELKDGAGDVYAAGSILLELLLGVDLCGHQEESEELTSMS